MQLDRNILKLLKSKEPLFGKWIIDENDVLGGGDNSIVYGLKGTSPSDDSAVIKIVYIEDEKQLNRMGEEIATVRKFRNSQKTIEYLGDQGMLIPHSDKKAIYYYVMPRYTCLSNYLKTGRLNESEALTMAENIADALIQMHSNRIIHRDVKPSNIFLKQNKDGRWSFLLGDFGISTDKENLDNRVLAGTRAFMAPESIENGIYDERTDIYSFGLTMYYVLNDNKLPFEDEYILSKAVEKRLKGATVPEPKTGNEALKTLVVSCCSFDPCKRRNSMKQVKEGILKAKSEYSAQNQGEDLYKTVYAVASPNIHLDEPPRNTTQSSQTQHRNTTKESQGKSANSQQPPTAQQPQKEQPTTAQQPKKEQPPTAQQPKEGQSAQNRQYYSQPNNYVPPKNASATQQQSAFSYAAPGKPVRNKMKKITNKQKVVLASSIAGALLIIFLIIFSVTRIISFNSPQARLHILLQGELSTPDEAYEENEIVGIIKASSLNDESIKKEIIDSVDNWIEGGLKKPESIPLYNKRIKSVDYFLNQTSQAPEAKQYVVKVNNILDDFQTVKNNAEIEIDESVPLSDSEDRFTKLNDVKLLSEKYKNIKNYYSRYFEKYVTNAGEKINKARDIIFKKVRLEAVNDPVSAYFNVTQLEEYNLEGYDELKNEVEVKYNDAVNKSLAELEEKIKEESGANYSYYFKEFRDKFKNEYIEKLVEIRDAYDGKIKDCISYLKNQYKSALQDMSELESVKKEFSDAGDVFAHAVNTVIVREAKSAYNERNKQFDEATVNLKDVVNEAEASKEQQITAFSSTGYNHLPEEDPYDETGWLFVRNEITRINVSNYSGIEIIYKKSGDRSATFYYLINDKKDYLNDIENWKNIKYDNHFTFGKKLEQTEIIKIEKNTNSQYLYFNLIPGERDKAVDCLYDMVFYKQLKDFGD